MMVRAQATVRGRAVGRYVIYSPIASGGMARVHLGRMLGPAGFARTVAIKCLHEAHAADSELTAALLEEARLTARIQHPNVIPVFDVISTADELFLVMDYVHGEALSRLMRLARDRAKLPEPKIAIRILIDVLHGLHAAHEAKSELGEPLGLVHRDVSPQNVMVGADGIARLLDFGVAKVEGRGQSTEPGRLKGKLAYMAPEQLLEKPLTRCTDVYAAGVVLWETLTNRRLFAADDQVSIVNKVLALTVLPPSAVVGTLPPELDSVVLRAIERDPSRRFQTAVEFARALEDALRPAAPSDVSEWVHSVAEERLEEQLRAVSAIELESRTPTVESERPRGRSKAVRLFGLVTLGVLGVLVVGVFSPPLLRREPKRWLSHAAWPARVVVSAPVESATPLPPAQAPPKQKAARPPAACNPPFRLDANGIRRWKPECS